MAYISQKCVSCRERTKRDAGGYSALDENGERFSGHLYLCNNSACEINQERMRGQKQLRMLEAERGASYER